MSSGSARNASSHLLAGATSGLLSAAALQPLDLIKTRLQQQPHATSVGTIVQQILANEGGVRALWRGTAPSLLRNVPGVAVYFYVLQGVRRTMTTIPFFATRDTRGEGKLSTLPRLSSHGNLLAGGASRVAVGFVLNPVTLLKARFESNLHTHNSLSASLRDVVQTYGKRGLLQGFGASALRDAPYAGLFVFSYEFLKREASLVPSLNGPVMLAVSGAAAAIISTCITQPFDVAKTRMQVRPKEFPTIWRTLTALGHERGLKGYFDGLSFRVYKKGLSSAISWAVYETLLDFMIVK